MISKFWQYLKNIAYVIFCTDIARLLQYFNNISDKFRNILVILQYFQGIVLQYFLNISVLCGYWSLKKTKKNLFYFCFSNFKRIFFWNRISCTVDIWQLEMF